MIDKNIRNTARITIVVDSYYRDLAGMAIVAMRLCSKGFQCNLTPYRFQDILETAPDFVLLPYLRTGSQDRVRQIMSTGIQVGILDTEGGVAMPGVETFANLIARSESVRQGIALYCAWAECIADCLIEKNLFNESQVEVTGTPRMDFYADPWKETVLATTSHLSQYSNNLILFNGNFGVGNPSGGPGKWVKKLMADGFDENFAYHSERTHMHALKLMSQLANRVSATFPEATVVYRPHPFEGLDAYHNLLDKSPNLHLIKEGSVYGWILRAKAVIQRGCTTAFEAGMAGVPTFSPSWVPTGWEIPNVDSVSVMCESEESLLNYIRDVLSDRFTYPQTVRSSLDQLIKDWFHASDGTSHQRVAHAISNLLSNTKTHVAHRERLELIQEFENASKSKSHNLISQIRRIVKIPFTLLSAKPAHDTNHTERKHRISLELEDTQDLVDAIHHASKKNKSLELPPVKVKWAKDVTNNEQRSIEMILVG